MNSGNVANLKKALKLYYENFGKPYDNLFEKWQEDNGFDDDDIAQEFQGYLNEALCIEFHLDDDGNNLFPLSVYYNKYDRDEAIFRVMQYCYKYGTAPPSPKNRV